MSNAHKAAELRTKAANYRVLGRHTNDSKTAEEILKLAAELEQQARGIDLIE